MGIRGTNSFHSTRITVSTGHTIRGQMQWSSSTQARYITTYDTTAGSSTSLTTTWMSSPSSTSLEESMALEGKNITSDNDVPGDTLVYQYGIPVERPDGAHRSETLYFPVRSSTAAECRNTYKSKCCQAGYSKLGVNRFAAGIPSHYLPFFYRWYHRMCKQHSSFDNTGWNHPVTYRSGYPHNAHRDPDLPGTTHTRYPCCQLFLSTNTDTDSCETGIG